MEDVKGFFHQFYRPNNAILVLAGDVTVAQVKVLAEKWFEPIPRGKANDSDILSEKIQNEYRVESVSSNVPLDALYMSFHMSGRADSKYHTHDLLSDILGRGKSSLLYQKLVEEKQIFNSISAFVNGSIDPGLLNIQGKLNQGHSLDEAEVAVWELLEEFKGKGISEEDLEKVKNKAESSQVFSHMELLNRAMNLAYAEMLGDAELVNQEIDKIRSVTVEQIESEARAILNKMNASLLKYQAEKNRNEN